MAKAKLEIDKVAFQKVVTDLEAATTFDSPSALWKAVENSEWAKALQPRPLTAAVAYARAKELGIVYKTQPGKPGGKNGLSGGNPNRTSRGTKMKAFAETFKRLKLETPKRFLPIVQKAQKGSAKACIKLKCLECSNWDSKEVKLCNIINCPLYPIRPFQPRANEETTE